MSYLSIPICVRLARHFLGTEGLSNLSVGNHEDAFSYLKKTKTGAVVRESDHHGSFPIAMKVLLGPLAKSGLETRVGSNLPAAINAALVYYVGKLNSGRPPAPIPDFLKVQGDPEDEEGSTTADMAAGPP